MHAKYLIWNNAKLGQRLINEKIPKENMSAQIT